MHIISSASPPPRPGFPWAEQGRTPSGGGPDGSFFQRAEALCSHHAVLLEGEESKSFSCSLGQQGVCVSFIQSAP